MLQAIKQYYRQLIPQLTDEVWEQLSAKLVVKQLVKGEHFIKAGTRCDYVAFINKGFLRFYNLIDGKEIVTGFASTNEYASEYASFLTRQPATDYIEALEPTELVLLSYSDVQQLYQQYPIFETFARKLAENLFIRLAHRNFSLMATSPEERYDELIKTQSELLQKIPQYMLASYLGITPEHLSRIRKKKTQNSSSN